LAYVRWHK